ncbi:MAG: branched-chain amino acid aminotransferase [Alphaproteobacteria bacterium]|nr:branched-chain amino acid aminotransferase [Alphaproteobacteria bacterium]
MLGDEKGKIWIDGQMVEWADAKIHVLSHTLHYGSGVFEGERAYRGKIFRMQEHHERLHASAKMTGFDLPYTVEEINKAAEEVLKINGLTEAYVRPVAWHGAESLSVASLANSVHVAIAAWKWASYFDTKEGAAPGIRLMWSDYVRPAPNVGPVFAKANGQYISGMLGKNKAMKAGYDDALMLDYRGYVAECTGANIFMVKGGVLITPIADCFLNGITRKTVIEMAHERGIPFMEKHFYPDELAHADEVFIAGTAVEVQPIAEIGTQKYTTGPITRRMIEAYTKRVNGEDRKNA